jgi:hypothetical protein
MTIQLTPEQEQVIGRAIEAGLIKTVDDVVGMGAGTIQRRLEQRQAPVDSTSAELWLQDFHNWVHSHSTTTPLLSDEAINRESIYGTRGQQMPILIDTGRVIAPGTSS